MKINATVSIEMVSPDQAMAWLENIIKDQRNVRESHVANLSSEIVGGKWKLSPDAILLIKNKLANGQHRLWAVVNTGKTVPFLVVRTSDEEIFKVVDSGIKRTVGDVLKHFNSDNYNNIAAATNWILKYRKNQLTLYGQTGFKKNKDGKYEQVLTRSEIIDFARENHEELLECFTVVAPMYKRLRIFPLSTAMAFRYLANSNKTKADNFLQKVFCGGDQDGPTFLLRERLIRNAATKKYKLNKNYRFALLIKAFNYYLKDSNVSNLKLIDGEPFPKINK